MSSQSQKYIGIPNGIVLCVNERSLYSLSAVMWHGYREDGIEISDEGQLLFVMDAFFDEINYPFPATTTRSFQGPETPHRRKEHNRVMSDEKLLEKHGDLGTFIIRVQQRQNSSWQGRITWVEENKTMNFRSMWEMVKLIDSALDTVSADEEVSWDK